MFVTDGFTLNLTVLRSYWTESLRPAIHWYLWDIRQHPWLFVGLQAARLAALVGLLWAMVTYTSEFHRPGLYGLTLEDGLQLLKQHPLVLSMASISFMARFRKMTYWLRRKGGST